MMIFKFPKPLKRLLLLMVVLTGVTVGKAGAQSSGLVDVVTARTILKNQINLLTPQMGTDPSTQAYQNLGRKVVYYGQILYMLDQNYPLAQSIEEGAFVLLASDEHIQVFMNVPSPETTIRNLVTETRVLLSK